MKQSKIFLVFLFLFFFLLIEFDYGYSFFFRTDNNLKEEMVLPVEYENLQKENEELKSTLNIFETNQEKQVSKVVLHDPYEYFNQVTILKGKEEGLKENDFVWNEEGYIGRVKEIRNHSSIVELFTSSHTSLPVIVQNSSGVLEREGEDLVVKKIISKEKIEEGSIIYTSIYSDIHLSIPVAKVISVKNSNVEQTLTVTPLIHLEDLNYVFVERPVTYD